MNWRVIIIKQKVLSNSILPRNHKLKVYWDRWLCVATFESYVATADSPAATFVAYVATSNISKSTDLHNHYLKVYVAKDDYM